MQDENLIDFPNIEIMSENHAIEHKSPTTNKEMTNTQSDLQLRQIDKNLNESNKLLLNNICIEQDLSQSNSENSNETMASPDLNVNSIKREPINEELSYQSAASSGHEMPVLSPELDVVQPKLEEYTSVNPPFLEISGHEFRKEKKMDIKMFTTDLGPDNYDVVEIKVEPDDDDVTNNIETVRETKPAIEAHNLDTLLEQFEASEALLNNNNKPMVEKFNKNKKANISTYNKQISYVPNNKYVPTNQNKTIKDALPREVIERIK
uniref:Uncharacterized protein n=3 Tax=Rhodnius prolixus TaxID=13249 RepID=T1HNK5_RHOPR